MEMHRHDGGRADQNTKVQSRADARRSTPVDLGELIRRTARLDRCAGQIQVPGLEALRRICRNPGLRHGSRATRVR